MGREGSRDGEFRHPSGIAQHADGRVFVADSGNHRVQAFAADGSFAWTLGGADAPSGLRDPTSLAADARGVLYVVDKGNRRVQVFELPD